MISTNQVSGLTPSRVSSPLSTHSLLKRTAQKMRRALGLFFVGSLVLSGCATGPMEPITFSPDSLRASGSTVGVLIERIPATNTAFPGADCLLCLGAASLANAKLTTRVRQLKHENFDNLSEKLFAALKTKNVPARVVIDGIDTNTLKKFKGDKKVSAQTDYRSLGAKHSIDKLIVIKTYNQGVTRPYSSYIPNDVPKAHVSGIAFLVDLNTNNYLWYQEFEKFRAAAGEWKEPPNFPGLTNAYYQTVAEMSDRIVEAFLSDDL